MSQSWRAGAFNIYLGNISLKFNKDLTFSELDIYGRIYYPFN